MFAGNKIFDDLAKVAGGAAGALSGLSGEIKNEIKSRVDEVAMKMDLVPREDFERLEATLAQTRSELTQMSERLDALETTKSKSVKTKK